MLKKLLLSIMVFAGLLLVSTPASAYVQLVLAPTDYTYNPQVAPEITVVVSDTFTLGWYIATDTTFTTIGIQTSISWNPELETLTTETTPVDDSSNDFGWNLLVGTVNEGNNTTGILEYKDGMGLGEEVTKGPGQYLLGEIVFHCEGVGDEVKGTTGQLLSTIANENLFTGCTGVLVHQIPEPVTMVLLGGGLIFGGFAYRRKK